MKLHERLHGLRIEHGLTQLEVARRSDVSNPYISDLERGRTNPSLDTLSALAHAYRLTTQQVLDGVNFGPQGSTGGLPKGLADLAADPVLGSDLTSDWLTALARIEHNGKRPRTALEYYEIFTHLRRILAPEEATK